MTALADSARTGTSADEPSSPDLHRVRLGCRLGMDVVTAKLGILRDQLRHRHDADPVERVSSRLKSVDSIVAKARRKEIPLSAEDIRARVRDIAGVRVVCRFASDLYRVRELLLAQPDVVLLSERDYIAHPKPSGYRSVHLIVEVPVFLPGRVEHATVEIQLRTVAMDHWARLEHQICYKGEKDVPRHVRDSLRLAADVAWSLDLSMEHLHHEARGPEAGWLPPEGSEAPELPCGIDVRPVGMVALGIGHAGWEPAA